MNVTVVYGKGIRVLLMWQEKVWYLIQQAHQRHPLEVPQVQALALQVPHPLQRLPALLHKEPQQVVHQQVEKHLLPPPLAE